MKNLIKKLISRLIQNDTIWFLSKSTIIKTSAFLEWHREMFEKAKNINQLNPLIDNIIEKTCPDLVVRNGVFKGMKYPSAKSVGSTLFPKLLGSYENELQSVLEGICSKKYTEIIDIGCAEGYYAIGLAIRIPSAQIFAYDIDKEAISLCKKMAEINNVKDRVILGDFCDSETLKSFPNNGKRLFVCDCEGYEKELFTEEVIPYLAKDDLLIEIHDLIDIEISTIIRQRFEKTHKIEVVESIDDIKKAKTYSYKEIEPYNLETRRILLGEHRPAIMEWFYLTPLK